MTTDITELAQSLKNAAEKAQIEEGPTWFSEEQLSHEDGLSLHKADAEFISLANPANILALVEALEKAQRHANLTEAERQAYLGLISKRDERIAELESRTVKIPGWFVKDAIAVYDRDEIEEALSAAGIKWEAE